MSESKKRGADTFVNPYIEELALLQILCPDVAVDADANVSDISFNAMYMTEADIEVNTIVSNC